MGSIRKQAGDAMASVDLLERDALSTELVTLLWMLYEHHGVVLFSGPTGVGKTTLMNAVSRKVSLGVQSLHLQNTSSRSPTPIRRSSIFRQKQCADSIETLLPQKQE
jgi:Flp pilus assembly CpaF family ATPase